LRSGCGNYIPAYNYTTINIPDPRQTNTAGSRITPQYLSPMEAALRRYIDLEWGSLECSESDSNVAE